MPNANALLAGRPSDAEAKGEKKGRVIADPALGSFGRGCLKRQRLNVTHPIIVQVRKAHF
jgi:hypothetical protein